MIEHNLPTKQVNVELLDLIKEIMDRTRPMAMTAGERDQLNIASDALCRLRLSLRAAEDDNVNKL